jgi:two-component system response regulator PilR (NtrC family)
MESEFFGHKKGSFTGAVSDKTGLFQAADGGTLFLDEVADLPLALQVKLLRAIQEKKIRPVGDQAEQTINVRILSATHKNLAQMIKVGEFRQDLFYRINVIELHAPPLRIRTNDIPQLVNHIITINASRNNINAPRLTPSAFEALGKHQFPGNVRELENILERAMALYEGDTIGVEDLGLTAVPEELTSQLQDPDPAANWQQSNSTLEDYLEGIERKMIEDVLEKNRWNKTAAAKQLGMSFRSLRYRLKKLGLD